MKKFLHWVAWLAPYVTGVVFLVAAGTKLYALPDNAPHLLRGSAEDIQYLAVLAVLIELLLGLMLLFASRKALICLVSLAVLLTFTGYLGYVYAFTEADCACGGGEQWVAESRFGKFWFSLIRNGVLAGALSMHLRESVQEI